MRQRHQNKERLCSVDGCNGEAKAKGLCHKHYQRMLVQKKREQQNQVLSPAAPEDKSRSDQSPLVDPVSQKITPEELKVAMRIADGVLRQPEVRAVLVAVLMKEMQS